MRSNLQEDLLTQKGVVMEKMTSKWARPFRKRLSIDIPTIFMDGIKKNAEKRNVTVTKYMIRLIAAALQLEKTYD